MDVTQTVLETLENKYKLRSLKFSTVAISSVVLVEVILGWLAGSLAVVSDGLHALLDAFTTLMLFIMTRESLKPPDEEHMYGHEKFEPIGGLIGGIALIGVALLIFYEAILRIILKCFHMLHIVRVKPITKTLFHNYSSKCHIYWLIISSRVNSSVPWSNAICCNVTCAI